MRIVEPKQFNNNEQTKYFQKLRAKLKLLLALLLILGIGAVLVINKPAMAPDEPVDESLLAGDIINEQNVDALDSEKTLRIFTDNEFKVFYDQLLQPNLERVENPPIITGNDIADTRIRKIAEDRGYRLRASPSIGLVNVDGNLLQSSVAQPWKDLQSAAAKEGLSMTVVSAYRTVSNQRQLFISRLSAAGATAAQVANGSADNIVNKVLVTTSIPGYSKHHTAYTVDLLCAGYSFENFKASPCNDWITKNNYKVAKEHGFIPSYPPLADAQGPDPEAWEYVWVGTELLYE